MTSTVTTTPQMKNFIGGTRNNKSAARAARTYKKNIWRAQQNNNLKLPHLRF